MSNTEGTVEKAKRKLKKGHGPYGLDDLIFAVLIAIVIGFGAGNVSSQLSAVSVAAILGGSATTIGVGYAIFHSYRETKTRRTMLDIVHQEDMLASLENIHFRLRNHIDAVSKRHDFSGGWGSGTYYPASKEFEGLIDKSIVDQLSKYENLSNESYRSLGIAERMARLTFQDTVNANFKASAKAFEEKLGSLWDQFNLLKICKELMWGDIEISKSWLEDNMSGLYQKIMEVKVERENISDFLSKLNEAFKEEDAFIILKFNVKKQAKLGEGILIKISEEEKKIQQKIDDLKTRVHPRELEEFRKREAIPKASNES